jgi:ATP-dependent Clp protease ATP-binding subunit ClpB
MTSNVGSAIIKQMATQPDKQALRAMIMEELDRHFRPEFLNRLDDVILFQSLTREDLERIVDIQLRRLERLLAERRITLELTSGTRQFLAERGYDPVFGARPLKRTIQRELQDPLALQIIEGKVREGDHVIVDLTLEGDQLVFSTVPQAEAV